MNRFSEKTYLQHNPFSLRHNTSLLTEVFNPKNIPNHLSKMSEPTVDVVKLGEIPVGFGDASSHAKLLHLRESVL
jgi:hypothetical protein